MKKILILGCSGFIGKNLGYHFSKKKNYKVYGTYLTKKPNIKNIKFYKLSITFSASLSSEAIGSEETSSEVLT